MSSRIHGTKSRLWQVAGVIVMCFGAGAFGAHWVTAGMVAGPSSAGELPTFFDRPVAYVFDGSLDSIEIEPDVFPETMRTVGVFSVSEVLLDGSQDAATFDGLEGVQSAPELSAGSEVRVFFDVATESPSTWGHEAGSDYRVWVSLNGNTVLNDERGTAFVFGASIDLTRDALPDEHGGLNAHLLAVAQESTRLGASEALLEIAQQASVRDESGEIGPLLSLVNEAADAFLIPTVGEQMASAWAASEPWQRGYEPEVAPESEIVDALRQRALVSIDPGVYESHPNEMIGLRHSGGVTVSVATNVTLSPADIFHKLQPLELFIAPVDWQAPGEVLSIVDADTYASDDVLLVRLWMNDGTVAAEVTPISDPEALELMARDSISAEDALRSVEQSSEVLDPSAIP